MEEIIGTEKFKLTPDEMKSLYSNLSVRGFTEEDAEITMQNIIVDKNDQIKSMKRLLIGFFVVSFGVAIYFTHMIL